MFGQAIVRIAAAAGLVLPLMLSSPPARAGEEASVAAQIAAIRLALREVATQANSDNRFVLPMRDNAALERLTVTCREQEADRSSSGLQARQICDRPQRGASIADDRLFAF